MVCPFCAGSALQARFIGQHHPTRPQHGPFDLHECRSCGSLTTFPLPSRAQLAELYGSFADGVPEQLRIARRETPLSAWFERALERVTRLAGLSRDRRFGWIEVGAGGGEFAALMSREFRLSSGIAVDWHARPALLEGAENLRWVECDLNGGRFAERLGCRADVVVALSVLEHVLAPDLFLEGLARLVLPGGLVYFVCPDYGSLARRVLGRRWPYYSPGEHLSMPTLRGARLAVHRALECTRTQAVRTLGSRIAIPYPFGYVLDYLGLGRLARVARALPPIPLPVGALEAGFIAGASSRGTADHGEVTGAP